MILFFSEYSGKIPLSHHVFQDRSVAKDNDFAGSPVFHRDSTTGKALPGNAIGGIESKPSPRFNYTHLLSHVSSMTSYIPINTGTPFFIIAPPGDNA
jgi:hypothetical protein